MQGLVLVVLDAGVGLALAIIYANGGCAGAGLGGSVAGAWLMQGLVLVVLGVGAGLAPVVICASAKCKLLVLAHQLCVGATHRLHHLMLALAMCWCKHKMHTLQLVQASTPAMCWLLVQYK
ncbi:hypothetical protein NL676_001307 [Syzygium grande]|nr:hypothetical protein NL676_001307 [Syzygium grande]